MLIKNNRLINRRMERGIEEAQGTISSKLVIFKWLLRNEVNKENIDGEKQRGKNKEEIHSSRVYIFR